MTRDQAIEGLRSLKAALTARGISHAAVFGSVAQDTATSRSDLDVIVTPAENVTIDLITLGAVQSLLEARFPGHDIDLVCAPVRDPALARAIEAGRADAF